MPRSARTYPRSVLHFTPVLTDVRMWQNFFMKTTKYYISRKPVERFSNYFKYTEGQNANGPKNGYAPNETNIFRTVDSNSYVVGHLLQRSRPSFRRSQEGLFV
jgi:hypothetical protein